MKKLFSRTILTTALIASSVFAFSQANDWIFPPSTRISFNTGSAIVSTLPSGNAIAGCGSGSTYLFQQYASVVSDNYNHGLVFVNNCGLYNLSGTNIFSGTYNNYQNVFSVPGLCANFYSISWEFQNGPPHYNTLVLRRLNATNSASVSEVSSSTLINDGYMHSGNAIAVAPLAVDGTRKIYLGDYTSLKSLTISASGTIGSISTVATLSSPIDTRSGMEVSPDGKNIVIGIGGGVQLYTIATGTFTTLGAFASGTTVFGFEYVPYLSNDRVYMSYHGLSGSGVTEGLGYVSLSAPTTLNDALGGIPGSLAKYGFGYTDIERAKDGKLYFAYNSGYTRHYVIAGDAGALYSLDPSSGTLTAIQNSGTQVYTNNVEDNWAFIIQHQIDGEVYDYANSTAFTPTFDVNSVQGTTYGNVTAVYLCNGTLTLNSTLVGVHSGFTVLVELGTITYGNAGNYYLNTFTANSSQPSGNSVTVPDVYSNASTDLMTLFSFLQTYTGPIRITVTNNSPCGNASSSPQFFNLVSPTDFVTIGPSDVAPYRGVSASFLPVCSSTVVTDPSTGATIRPAYYGAQDRNTIAVGASGPSFATVGTLNVCDPTLAPPCSVGWLGASSVGIFSGNLNTPSGTVGTISNFIVKVDEYTQAGGSGTALTFVKTVLNRTISTNLSAGGIPTIGYGFDNKTSPNHYFTNNYDAIKGVNVYKITYSATTANCGVISSYSYFKILDDGTVGDQDGGYNWKVTNVTSTSGNSAISVYPSPASDKLHFHWISKENHAAKVAITDILGHVIIRQRVVEKMGQNDLVIDIADIASGIYYYTAATASGVQKGTFVKK